jgi:hypothetical protein
MPTLFRPVGLHELALLWDSGMREFPPRLAHQPIFYPVANLEYARQIAAEWNVSDEASGFSGFVTQFDVADSHLADFEPHVVGASTHVEYWIPAEELPAFNRAIDGLIAVTAAFFGPRFQGWIPDQFGFKSKNAIEQFVILATSFDYSSMDFVLEISANRKTVYLNSCFWAQHDFSDVGIAAPQKATVLDGVYRVWEDRRIDPPLAAVVRATRPH